MESSECEDTYAKETLNKVEAVVNGNETKVLGLTWLLDSDELVLRLDSIGKISGAGNRVTKRTVLSSLAKVFDPLGLVSPVVAKAKSLFQELCVKKVGWDEDLDSESREEWERWERDLWETKVIVVPRCIHPHKTKEAIYSLHGFGDASSKAYCAVVYLVCESEDGIYSRLICSKTRIAPLKSLSIPRLELMSARILAKLMDSVKNALSDQIEIQLCKYWLDSKTALFWLNNAGEWKQFVRQRVNEILGKCDKESWNHCPGKENPADIGSRGMGAGKLKNSRIWWRGPEWLVKGKEFWPKNECVERTDEVDVESKKNVAVLVGLEVKKCLIGSVIYVCRFSEMDKLLRVTAMVLRFLANMKAKVVGRDINTSAISVEEMERSERLWVIDAQSTLSDKKDKCLLKNLGVYEDNGVLRCKGRLENSDLEVGARNPILIPMDHALAKPIAVKCHKKVNHLKIRSTLAEVRTKYWIPKGRLLVKRMLKKCVTCRRSEGRAYAEPRTAALPDFRVLQAEPFSNTGVDFAGPLYVKDKSGKMNKMYVALFSCCVTRAVNLQIVPELSTETFFARRGSPNLVISDNAKTFKAGARLLCNLRTDPGLTNYLQGERITWKFNLERTPWWGGFFERMIGTVKRCLRKVIGKAKLSEDELRIILLEVESTINSRPLTYLYEELDSEALTPSHLLYGRRLSTLPVEITSNENGNLYPKRYRYLVNKLKHFWNRWGKEYLVDLRENHKIQGKGTVQVSIGDVVLVQDDSAKRSLWRVGRIEEIIMGKDGAKRGAKVHIISRGRPEFISRPLQKLFPIEMRDEEEKQGGTMEGKEQCEGEFEVRRTENGTERPRRAAARDAIWRTRIILDFTESRGGGVKRPVSIY